MAMNVGFTEWELNEVISVIGESVGTRAPATGLEVFRKVLESRK
jgi:hypothetical protein